MLNSSGSTSLSRSLSCAISSAVCRSIGRQRLFLFVALSGTGMMILFSTRSGFIGEILLLRTAPVRISRNCACRLPPAVVAIAKVVIAQKALFR